MKKTYNRMKAFIVLLSMVALQMGAQISGIVTINSGLATGGTNYQTFNALATVLNTSGINGPLTVNVVTGTGPYNEQVTFNQITGVSATNTITINGNGCQLIFNATSTAPHTMLLNGTDRLYVNNLRMEGTNATYANGLCVNEQCRQEHVYCMYVLLSIQMEQVLTTVRSLSVDRQQLYRSRTTRVTTPV